MIPVILPNPKLQAWLMKPWTVDDMEKAHALKSSGWTIADIANLLDRTVDEIRAAIA